jgi:hypothetical protein
MNIGPLSWDTAVVHGSGRCQGGLTGEPGPGTDLGVGTAAVLRVDPERCPPAGARLLSWPG